MLIFVTDVIEYLICPVRLYLKKVRGLSKDNELMLKGTIVHRALEIIHSKEKEIWEEIDTLDYNRFKQKYYYLMARAIALAIRENLERLNELRLDEKEIINDIYPVVKREVNFRINYVWSFVERYGYDFPKRINPEIESEVLLKYDDLVGRIDRVEKYKSGRVIPIEIKTGKAVKDYHYIQLAGYAYLIEKNWDTKVNRGVLLYPRINRREVVELDPYKELFLELYEKVKSYLESPRFTKPKNGYCLKCDFREHCPVFRNKTLLEFRNQSP